MDTPGLERFAGDSPPSETSLTEGARTLQEFTIEKDVPIPKPRMAWPFREMDVGESFIIGDDKQAASNCRSTATHWVSRNTLSKKFRVRKTPDGYRCWRVA